MRNLFVTLYKINANFKNLVYNQRWITNEFDKNGKYKIIINSRKKFLKISNHILFFKKSNIKLDIQEVNIPFYCGNKNHKIENFILKILIFFDSYNT